MRLDDFAQHPDDYMQSHLGYSLTELIAPIGDTGVGESVRYNGVYSSIKEARKEDDPTLPMGVWTYDLRTADWQQVKNTALTALANKSKDLQLLIWLFEANLHIQGIAGIAPSTLLIQTMCEHYWDDMYPKIQDGDMEFRTNPLSWINDKLTAVLKSLPITQSKLDGEELSWNDWESAQYFEKLQRQKEQKIPYDGIGSAECKQRLMTTDTEFCLQQLVHIEDAQHTLQELTQWLDTTCGAASPSFNDFTRLLSQISDLYTQEMQRRGVRLAAPDNSNNSNNASSSDHDNSASGNSDGNGDGPTANPNTLNNRDDAFAALLKVADFLVQDDPHSIVPYLLYTAYDCGQLTAPQLYEDIFLHKGGQLNVFEMMGIEAKSN